MTNPKLLLAASAVLVVSYVPNLASANETMTVPGTVPNNSLVSACSLLVNNDLANVTPFVSFAPNAPAEPTIVRFSFRTTGGETVAMHDVRVPATAVTGQAPALHAFPFPAVAAGTVLHCDVTPVAAETIVDD